jgi:hypothetical protein
VILVVGGHSRKIGKSSVVENLIARFPQACWVAIKITTHQHETGSGAPYDLLRETEPTTTDSGRYLAAGAERSYLLRVSPGRLAEALPALRQVCSGALNTIIESNRIVEHLKPDLFLQVVDPTVEDWKDTAREHLHAAGGFVLVSRERRLEDSLELPSGAPRFLVAPPRFASPELYSFVAERLRLEPRKTPPKSA